MFLAVSNDITITPKSIACGVSVSRPKSAQCGWRWRIAGKSGIRRPRRAGCGVIVSEVRGRNPDQILKLPLYISMPYSICTQHAMGNEMEIKKEVYQDILLTLHNYYPDPLMSDGYQFLSDKYGEAVLDGHLVYLSQKGLITCPHEYVYLDEEGHKIRNPIRGQGGWLINPTLTFITSSGIDYVQA
ncbi:hypothetical protein [Klebsiella pneumoniae]|uniref:hypothetical protein n=1 Tax=Klebsiella pneumoniae TaxID=573 RepID=UPI0035248B1E